MLHQCRSPAHWAVEGDLTSLLCLRRHIPVGVLYDLLASSMEEPCQLTVSTLLHCTTILQHPCLTHAPYIDGMSDCRAIMQVHFRAFPSDLLLRWEGEQTLRAAYFNSLKVRYQDTVYQLLPQGLAGCQCSVTIGTRGPITLLWLLLS